MRRGPASQHKLCKVLVDQKLKYVKSLSKRKMAMVLEVNEMKRVNSNSFPCLDSTKGDVCDDSQRTSFTRYPNVLSSSRPKKCSKILKHGITAEEFLRLGQKTSHNEIDRRKGDHLDSTLETAVLEFEDIKPELPIESIEQKQLLNMVRRFRLSSLGNRTIQNVCRKH